MRGSVFLCLYNRGKEGDNVMSKAVKDSEKAKLTITIDADMKRQFAQLCEDIGLPMGTVISALMSQAVRKQEVRISSLDVNGFTPREAAEILRRWKNFQAMQKRPYTTENDE